MTFKTDLSAETWIVVADGARARVLEEAHRHGPLSLVGETVADPRARHRAHMRASVHQRSGAGRHAEGDSSPADAAETKFLEQVAEEVRAGAAARRCKRLVLIAPPKALGVLRAALDGRGAPIEAADPHDRTREPVEAIRRRLKDLRLPA